MAAPARTATAPSCQEMVGDIMAMRAPRQRLKAEDPRPYPGVVP